MPPLKPVNGVARFAFLSRANTIPIVNIFHVRKGSVMAVGPWSLAELTTFTTAIITAYAALWKPSVATGTVLEQVVATDLTGPSAPQVIENISGQTGTGGAASTVPQSAACCISWRIPRHYRGGHPRSYMGPLAAPAISNPTSLATAYTDALLTRAQDFVTAMSSTPVGSSMGQLCAVHRQIGGVEVEIPETSNITGVIVDTRIDSQRRRLGKDR